MNSYTLGITGSWWIFAICALLGIALSWWSYQVTNPPLSSVRKFILGSLRALALSLLLFALFEPVLSMIRASLADPRLAIVIDKSLSMSLKDGRIDRAKALKQAIASSNIASLNEDDIEIVVFGEDAKGNIPTLAKADSIPAKGLYTNITKALNILSEADESDVVQAAIVFTDGAVNAGANPLYEAELFGRPIFTVGIGDSLDPRDASIQSILVNEIVYAGTKVPIAVTVRATGFPDASQATVAVYDNGSLIGKESITLKSGLSTYSVSVQHIPSQPGIHKITARVSTSGNELTLKNNELSEFMKVLKQKRIISVFAGSPSPDLTFIKTVLERIPDSKISLHVQKQGSEFYPPIPSAQSLSESESILLIGFPIASTPPSLMQMIRKEVENGKPLMFIASQQVDYQRLSPLEPFLPFSVTSTSQQEFMAIPNVEESGEASPIMRVLGDGRDTDRWNSLPPIYKTETFVNVKPESEILATIRIGTAPIQEPLIMTRTFAGKRSLAVLGYGLYRWKLLGMAPDIARGASDMPDILSAFIDQSIQWIGASEKEQLVKIRSSRKFYIGGERVELIGQVYNASLDPVDDAIVSVTLTGPGTKRDIRLANMGAGRYSASISGLPAGDYFYQGSAVKGSVLGKDDGRFVIGAESAEYLNLKMNAPLLRSMSELTGGTFYTPNTVSTFLEDLKKHPRFTQTSIVKESELALWNNLWLLLIAITAFACEWFFRKRSGLI
ncbi:MAG: CARDB domain-containing protein [Candidatus Kapaibacteriota bacterium]